MVETATGEWYLGGEVEPGGERIADAPILYESHHLTTHGVIVGMTGSGKTGLGIVALEEALLAGVPCLIIDPKGDMGNLLLNFPSFDPAEFQPWIDEGEARRQGKSPEEVAAATAELWKDGLAGWEIGSDRMRQLGTGAGFAIYTPGSAAGIPVNIVGSLEAPALDWNTEAETIRAEIEGFVSSLLVLAGAEADPISSPEHILLSTIIEQAWTAGQNLDLATLIGQVQSPPMRKLGVFELDTFFPPKDRTKLAMRLNGLVASPTFASWIEGPPLEIESLLHDSDGRPKASVIYLSHLSDSERQFIVTLLLSKVVTWMRTQQGTSDLRALIYMDEVFGFAPPTQEPPSKKPILTLLKQARAFGVGLLLSTQNPVDLDYKAMSNAGTWMIGRLQTERDKARILEGLKSASGAVDVKAFDKLISDLGKREFVMHSTRAKQPQVFTTRWAMSFLAGPISREQVTSLMAGERQAATTATAQEATGATAASPEVAAPAPSVPADDESQVAPQVADGVRVFYLDPAAPWGSEVGADPTSSRHQAALVARVDLVYDDQHADVDHAEEWEAVYFPIGDRFDPALAIAVDYDDRDLRTEAPEGVRYVLPQAKVDTKAFFSSAQTDLKNWLYQQRSIEVYKNPELKIYSRVGEGEDEFRARCVEAAEAAADEEVAALKDKYERRIESVRDQLSTAERRVRELEVDVQSRRQTEILSGAGDLLSVFVGGRRRSRGLSAAASRRSQTRRTQERLSSAQEKMLDKETDLAELEDDLARDVEEIVSKWDHAATEIETVEIGLEKTDIRVDEMALLWIPVPG